jgi:hypothetical protein
MAASRRQCVPQGPPQSARPRWSARLRAERLAAKLRRCEKGRGPREITGPCADRAGATGSRNSP